MWQRVDEPGRNRRDGRRKVYFAGAGCASLFQREIRHHPASAVQIPLRRRQEERF